MPQLASGIFCCGPSFFVTAAFILSIFANGRCNFLNLDSDNTLREVYEDFRASPVSIGTWCWESENGNYYSYSGVAEATGGDRLTQARALGTTSSSIGFCLWLFYIFASCVRFGPMTFRLVGLLAILNTAFQGLVFLLQQTTFCDGTFVGGCSLGTGGNCAIAAAVLYFVGGLLSCAAGKEAQQEEEEAEAAQRDVEEAAPAEEDK